MYLYLDLIWLLNFFIDYLLLWLTGVFRSIHVSKWRLSVAAAVGSCYVFILFLPSLSPSFTFVLKVILSLSIVWLAFGFVRFQAFIANWLTFYFVTFITGGGIFALQFFVQSNHQLAEGMVITSGGGFGDPVSWWVVVLGFPIMIWFSKYRWKTIEKTASTVQQRVKIHIEIQNKTMHCWGLIDTGNQLYSPFSQTPVIVVQSDQLVELIPDEVLQLATKDVTNVHNFHLKDDYWMQRIRLIPYRSIDQNMGVMVALKPDHLIVETDQHCLGVNSVIVAISTQVLDHQGMYQAIIHPDVLLHTSPKEAI